MNCLTKLYITGYNFDFMLKKHKKFLDGVYTKNDLRKPPSPRAAKTPSIGKLNIENSAITDDFQKVLDHFNDSGMTDKAKLLKMVFEKPNIFSKHLLAVIECPEGQENMDKINELPPQDALALLLRLDLSNAQYQGNCYIGNFKITHFYSQLKNIS